MRDLLALKSAGLIAGLFATAMLVLWALVSVGFTTFIVPPPETTGEQFLRALNAHRFEAARDQLSQELRQQVSVAELRNLVESLEARHGGISQVSGDDAQKQGEIATAAVQVRMEDGQERVVPLPFKQEHGLWKITSIDSVRDLAAR